MNGNLKFIFMKYPKLPPSEDKRRKVTSDMKKQMASLKREGLSDRVIGDMLHLNHTTVRYHTNTAYRERKNRLSVARLKGKPFTPDRSAIQKKSRQHRIDTIGYEAVNTFERTNRKQTRHKHTDYRHTCSGCGTRYSYRLHKACPDCAQAYPHQFVA